MFASCRHARALAACFSHQDHVWITTDEWVRFHNNEFDEMPCKPISTVNPRLFEKYQTLHLRNIHITNNPFTRTLAKVRVFSRRSNLSSSQNSCWDCYGSFDEQRLFSVKFARFRNFFDFAQIWGILESDKLWEIQSLFNSLFIRLVCLFQTDISLILSLYTSLSKRYLSLTLFIRLACLFQKDISF